MTGTLGPSSHSYVCRESRLRRGAFPQSRSSCRGSPHFCSLIVPFASSALHFAPSNFLFFPKLFPEFGVCPGYCKFSPQHTHHHMLPMLSERANIVKRKGDIDAILWILAPMFFSCMIIRGVHLHSFVLSKHHRLKETMEVSKVVCANAIETKLALLLFQMPRENVASTPTRCSHSWPIYDLAVEFNVGNGLDQF